MAKCPCGSLLEHSKCCEPYLNNSEIPPTPEALMRSRYTAYTQADIVYIQKTMRGKAAEHFDPAAAKQWASSVNWIGLTVIDAPEISSDAEKGEVTFIARFSDGKRNQVIHERSQFIKIDNRWFYIDGTTPDVSRNTPCPCRSGKKAKRCCFS